MEEWCCRVTYFIVIAGAALGYQGTSAGIAAVGFPSGTAGVCTLLPAKLCHKAVPWLCFFEYMEQCVEYCETTCTLCSPHELWQLVYTCLDTVVYAHLHLLGGRSTILIKPYGQLEVEILTCVSNSSCSAKWLVECLSSNCVFHYPHGAAPTATCAYNHLITELAIGLDQLRHIVLCQSMDNHDVITRLLESLTRASHAPTARSCTSEGLGIADSNHPSPTSLAESHFARDQVQPLSKHINHGLTV